MKIAALSILIIATLISGCETTKSPLPPSKAEVIAYLAKNKWGPECEAVGYAKESSEFKTCTLAMFQQWDTQNANDEIARRAALLQYIKNNQVKPNIIKPYFLPTN